MSLRFIKARPRVTMQEILDLKSSYSQWHSRRIAQHKEDMTYFNLTYPVPSPDSKSPLKSPSGYQVVEQLINHLVAEYPTFHVMPRTSDESEQKKAGKLTSWVGGFWRRVELSKILREMLFFDAVRGCHVLRVQTNWSAWPIKPEPPEEPIEPGDFETAPSSEIADYVEKLLEYQNKHDKFKQDYADYLDYTEEHLPFKVRAIDPQYVFWEPTDDPKKVVIVWDRTVDDIIADHPYTYDLLGDIKPGTKVQFCEYHDEYESAYWTEAYGGQTGGMTSGASYVTTGGNRITYLQEPFEHGYGFFPFIIDGPWVTPLDESDKKYPSLYFAIKQMLQYESSLLTQMAHMIRVNGWAPLIVKTDRPDSMKPSISMQPGATNYLEQDEDAHYLEFSGQTMAILEKLINATDAYTQKGTGLGDILQGAPKGKSGYQQAQIAAMARVALTPVEHSTTRTLVTATRQVLKMVRLLDNDEKITVVNSRHDGESVTTIGPRDVQKFGEIQVQLKTVLPIDEGAKIANITNMQKAGWISRVTAARMAGVENPEDERARAEAEAMALQPQVQQAETLIWAQEHWPDLYEIMVQMLQKGQGPKNPNGPQAGPGGPGGAGGGAQLSQPGQPRPSTPGAMESGQVNAQSMTGGMPQRRLREGAPEVG